MFCYHCGAQIPDESAFCQSCGRKIVIENTTLNVTNDLTGSSNANTDKNNERKSDYTQPDSNIEVNNNESYQHTNIKKKNLTTLSGSERFIYVCRKIEGVLWLLEAAFWIVLAIFQIFVWGYGFRGIWNVVIGGGLGLWIGLSQLGDSKEDIKRLSIWQKIRAVGSVIALPVAIGILICLFWPNNSVGNESLELTSLVGKSEQEVADYFHTNIITDNDDTHYYPSLESPATIVTTNGIAVSCMLTDISGENENNYTIMGFSLDSTPDQIKSKLLSDGYKSNDDSTFVLDNKIVGYVENLIFKDNDNKLVYLFYSEDPTKAIQEYINNKYKIEDYNSVKEYTYQKWKDDNFEYPNKIDIKLKATPGREVDNMAVLTGTFWDEVIVIVDKDGIAAEDWQWINKAETDDEGFAYFTVILQYMTTDEQGHPVFVYESPIKSNKYDMPKAVDTEPQQSRSEEIESKESDVGMDPNDSYYLQLEGDPGYVEVISSDGYVNLRTGPGTEYDILTEIPTGSELAVYETAYSSSGKTWYYVGYSAGTYYNEGYVAESQVRPIE